MRGDLLEYASEAYVRKLYRGSVVVVGSILLYVLVMIAGIAMGVLAPVVTLNQPLVQVLFWVVMVCGVVSSIGIAVGWWLLSEPNPAALDPKAGGTARQVVRVTAGISVVTHLAQQVIGLFSGSIALSQAGVNADMGLALLLGLLRLVTFGVSFFAQMAYLKWLASRLPDAWVYRRAKLMMWLGPALFVVGALCAMLGPIVALVLYYNLITRVRADLKGILANVRRTAGAPARA